MSTLPPSADSSEVDGIVSQAAWWVSVAHLGAWLSATLAGKATVEEVARQPSRAVYVTWDRAGDSESLLVTIGRLRRAGAQHVTFRLFSPGDMPLLLAGEIGNAQMRSGADLVVFAGSRSVAVIVPGPEREGLWLWDAVPSDTEHQRTSDQVRRRLLEEVDRATDTLTDLGTSTPHAGVADVLRALARLESSLTFPATFDADMFFRGLRLWAIATLARTVTTPLPTSLAVQQRDAVLGEVARVARRSMEASCALVGR